MKIFGKMILSFAIVIALFLALNIYNLTQASLLKQNSDTLLSYGVTPSIELSAIAQLTENTRVQMLSALAFENVDATSVALSNLNSIQNTIQTFETTILSDELRAATANFQQQWLLFDERVRLNEQLMRAQDWVAAAEGLKLGGPLFNEAMVAFNDLKVAHIEEINDVVAQSEQVYEQIILYSIILIILAVTAAVVIAYLFSRNFVKRLAVVAKRAQLIAEGDLTQTPIETTGRDELTDVAKHLNQMQTALSQVVSEANSSAQQVSASAEQLSATTQQNMAAAEAIASISQTTVESANTQLTSLTQITDALTEMDTTVQLIAENGSQMDTLSRNAYKKTQSGVQAVEEVNSQIQSIAESAKETELAVKSLNNKSQQISNIVGMITEIADQTNLLSLNAAIEAARAGDSGKGFAVVADQVRKLADESRQSAEQIFNMVQEIQGDIQGVIHSIHEESERVSIGLVKSQEVNKVFVEIENMVGDVSHNANGLTDSIEAIAHISQTILTNTQEVNTLANDSLQDAYKSNRSTETQLGSMEEIAAASESLADLSEQLQTVISHFKL